MTDLRRSTDTTEIRIAALNEAVYCAAHRDHDVTDEDIVLTASVFELYIKEGYRRSNFL